MSSRRAEAHKGYAAALAACATKEDHEEVTRQLALNDLFFLLVYVLNRPDADRDWLFDRCREVAADPNGRLDLWGRFHYKSTIITFALNIQEILRNPEITICILSFNRPTAKAFLKQIKREFELNTLLKQLFGDVLWAEPQRQAPQWSEDGGIVVKRVGNPKESTIEAWGLVEGQPTGRHFDILNYDDVVTRESVTSPDMIKKVTEAWELSLALTTEGGISRYAGTRYHFNDTYATIIKRETAKPRVHAATFNGEANGEPVLLPKVELQRLRKDMGPYTFACQMLLNPRADSTQGFLEEWLNFWPAQHLDGMNVYIVCDPANEKKKDSDYTVFWVIGLGADENYYVITVVRDRLNLSERWAYLLALHREFKPVKVGYEQYGMQADIAHFKEKMKDINYRFPIVPLAGKMPKPDRIKRLVPVFKEGRIYLPDMCWRQNYEERTENLTQIFIDEEYLAFPVATHEDMLDALARIIDENLGAAFPRTGRAAKRPTTATKDYDPHAN